MNKIAPDRFVEFYKAAYGKQDDPEFGPFPWQERVAESVCNGKWPQIIALPTAAGKTACIDIAVFALACRAENAVRRIIFTVDRRIVVDQAWRHAQELAARLLDAKSGILKDIAESLRNIAQDDRPLDVFALRGGMYRESAWARSPFQPTIIASTVDQIGSRLLFRGYGVSDSMKPVHAGLLGNDAIIFLDEAHCSKPFNQTMRAIENYRKWNESPAAFHFVSLSATPDEDVPDSKIERDNEEDRHHKILGKRMTASKPATLIVAEKAKGKNWRKPLVEELKKRACEMAVENGCVGIIVNRVATARDLKRELERDHGGNVVLLTGRMRPLDRDRLFEEKLKPLLSNSTAIPPKFVIGTQCLEVGADFDFHVLITECASLDALRQRFGRLNRIAKRDAARGIIVVRGDQVEPKEKESDRDPVYENSLSLTWKWLNDHQDGKVGAEDRGNHPWIDFSINSIREKLKDTPKEETNNLNAPSLDAPVLFPAHLDCWVQTHPIPMPDPDPALFLHGPNDSVPDVQVVFREDLNGQDSKGWADIVSLCPPSSSEFLPVRPSLFKKWLSKESLEDVSSDLEGDRDEVAEGTSTDRQALKWKGPGKSIPITNPADVYPNDVFILPTCADDAQLLGDFPGDEGIRDLSEEAYQQSRDRAFLRLEKYTLDDDSEGFEDQLTEQILARETADSPNWLKLAVKYLKDSKNRRKERYPGGGWAIYGKKRLGKFMPEFLDDDDSAFSSRPRPVTMKEHSSGVSAHARRFAEGCNLETEIFASAGAFHDLGKLDPRFQKKLKGFLGGVRLAKSGMFNRIYSAIHRYPEKGRHELLSAAMVATQTDDDLLLHLISTHHGYARPFADSVDENEAAKVPFDVSLLGNEFHIDSSAQQIANWNAVLPERFWRVVRNYGWWGAAYREAVFRLADHTQSRLEEEEKETVNDEPSDILAVKLIKTSKYYSLPLSGLDGSNPLAFLAALGILAFCDRKSNSDYAPDWLKGEVRLSWGCGNASNIPVMHFPSPPPNQSEFAKSLHELLEKSTETHPVRCAIEILKSDSLVDQLRSECKILSPEKRRKYDWITAIICESLPDASSPLQIVRSDYLLKNIPSVLKLTNANHIDRTLFSTWDYADSLDNQSLHWEPTEDRRHAYQWHMPSGDPTRKKRGGMLGANRLALEAWPLFPLFSNNDRAVTRGFQGRNIRNTFWTWPLWNAALSLNGIVSVLGLPQLQEETPNSTVLSDHSIQTVFRSQRILVNKTPNLTTAIALG